MACQFKIAYLLVPVVSLLVGCSAANKGQLDSLIGGGDTSSGSSGTANHVVVSSASSVGQVGTCFGPINVTLVDESGATVRSNQNLVVNLSVNGTGSYFSNSSCSTLASSLTIANGESANVVYFQGSTAGFNLLYFSPVGLTGSTLPINISSGAPAAVRIAGSSTLTVGVCSSEFTASLVDASGYSSNAVFDTTVTLAGAGSGVFYSDPGCSVVASSLVISTGSSSRSFYFKDSLAEGLTLTGSASSLTTGSLATTVSGGATPTRLAMSASSLIAVAGTCFGPMTVSATDNSGTPLSVAANATVTLSTGAGSGQFYTSSACTTSTTTVTIPASSSSATVYFKSTVVQNLLLFSSASGLMGGSMNFAIIAAPPAGLALTMVSSVAASACTTANTASLLDAYGNTSAATSTTAVALSGGGSGQFYSDSSCSTAVSSVNIANGASQVYFYFKDSAQESLTISAASGGLTGASASLTVTGGGAATKVLLSSNANFTSAGICYGPMAVSSTDNSNAPIAVASNTVVTLSGHGGGSFYSDLSCTNAVTQVTIGSGTSSASFYFKDPGTENLLFQASATGYTSTTLPFSVTSNAPTKLSVTGNSSISAGVCSSAMTVTLQDSLNNTAPATSSTTVNLSGGGSGFFYSDISCTTTITSLTISSGGSTGTFYFKDTSVESLTLSAGGTGLASGTKALSITANSPTQLAVGVPPSVPTGLCSLAFTAFSQDSNGNNANVSANKTVNLSGGGSGVFYSDSGCVTPITSVVISSGTSSTQFYFKDSVSETLTISAASSGFVTGSNTFTVTTNSLTKIILSGVTSTSTYTCSGAIVATAADFYGNAYTVGSNTTVNLSGGGSGTFYSDSGCSTPVTSITIGTGTTNTSFYFQTTAAGALTLTAASTGLTSGTLGFTVNGLPVSQIGISGPTSLTTYTCSTAYTVTLKDSVGNATNPTSTTTVNLTGNGVGAFYSDSSCTSVITSLTYNTSTSAGTFYFKNRSGQSLTFTAASAGLTSGTISITQTPTLTRNDLLVGGYYTQGSADGTARNVRFSSFGGMFGDSTNLYVADCGNNTIRSLNWITGIWTTVAGAVNPITSSSPDGIGSAARMSCPNGGGPAIGGLFYFADYNYHSVRAFNPSTNAVTTIAGSNGSWGTSDGTGTVARFRNPSDTPNDGTNIYVLDSGNDCIRKVTTAGVVTTLAGSCGSNGYTDSATASSVRFGNMQRGVVTGGFLYTTDWDYHTVRKTNITTGETTTFAGGAGSSGCTNGTGTGARFWNPTTIVTDGTNLYVTDTGCSLVRQIVIASGVVTTIAGSYSNGWGDGIGTSASVKFRQSQQYAAFYDGTSIYIGENVHYAIRKLDLTTMEVSTFAGPPNTMLSAIQNQSLQDGTGTAPTGALVNNPQSGVEVNGVLYFTEWNSHTVRALNLGTLTVTTLAGLNGNSGTSDGTGMGARFSNPSGITSDGTNLYVVDNNSGSCIRKVVIATGVVTTFSGVCGSSGTTDSATASSVRYSGGLRQITIDSTNTYMYAADYYNCVIRKITVATGGSATFVGGMASCGSYTNATGTSARFSNIIGVTYDGTDFYASDTGYHTIRKITSGGVVTTLAGTAGSSSYVDSATSANARFWSPYWVATDGTYVYATEGNSSNSIRRIAISNGATSTFVGTGAYGSYISRGYGESDDGSLSVGTVSMQGIYYSRSGLFIFDSGNIRLIH